MKHHCMQYLLGTTIQTAFPGCELTAIKLCRWYKHVLLAPPGRVKPIQGGKMEAPETTYATVSKRVIVLLRSANII